MSENIKRIGSTSEGVLYVLIRLLFIAPQLSDSSRSSLGVSSGNGPVHALFQHGLLIVSVRAPPEEGEVSCRDKNFQKRIKEGSFGFRSMKDTNCVFVFISDCPAFT